jgi:predicted RNA-binding protein associated with RNAse of E/G family
MLEIKHTLGGEMKTYRCRALEVTADRAALVYVLPHAARVAGLELPAQTVTIAYYWAVRPYNVYHWISPRDATIAYYFNASGPVRIAADRVEWDDLEVDVLVMPCGGVRVLDEDLVPPGAAGRAEEIASAQERILRESASVIRDVEHDSRLLLAGHPDLLPRGPDGRPRGPDGRPCGSEPRGPDGPIRDTGAS